MKFPITFWVLNRRGSPLFWTKSQKNIVFLGKFPNCRLYKRVGGGRVLCCFLAVSIYFLPQLARRGGKYFCCGKYCSAGSGKQLQNKGRRKQLYSWRCILAIFGIGIDCGSNDALHPFKQLQNKGGQKRLYSWLCILAILQLSFSTEPEL